MGPMLFELPYEVMLPLLPSRRRWLAASLRRAEKRGESREQNADWYDILARIDRILAEHKRRKAAKGRKRKC